MVHIISNIIGVAHAEGAIDEQAFYETSQRVQASIDTGGKDSESVAISILDELFVPGRRVLMCGLEEGCKLASGNSKFNGVVGVVCGRRPAGRMTQDARWPIRVFWAEVERAKADELVEEDHDLLSYDEDILVRPRNMRLLPPAALETSDLNDAVLSLLLSNLTADELCKAACACHRFHKLVSDAAHLAARRRGFALPPPRHEQEAVLSRLRFVELLALPREACRVACGNMHALAVLDDGGLVSWGTGSYEACADPNEIEDEDGTFIAHLGHGGEHVDFCGVGEPVAFPRRVSLPVRVLQVSAGALHSLAVDENRGVWSWGWGGNGRLGHGDRNHRDQPSRIEALDAADDAAAQVSAGSEHSLVLTAAGRIYSFGKGLFGRLGHRHLRFAYEGWHDLYAPALLTHVCDPRSESERGVGGYLGVGGLMEQMGGRGIVDKIPTSCRSMRFVQVSAGGEHSLILRDDGTVFVCGCCHEGRQGLGPPPWDQEDVPRRLKGLPKCHMVTAGAFHSVAVARDYRKGGFHGGGKLYAWGIGSSCGNGCESDVYTPTEVQDHREGGFKLFNGNRGRGVKPIRAFTGCNSEHTLVVLESGRVFAFGSNYVGELGTGMVTKNTPRPVESFLAMFRPLRKYFNGPRSDDCLPEASVGASMTVLRMPNGDIFACGVNGPQHEESGYGSERLLGVDDSALVPSTHGAAPLPAQVVLPHSCTLPLSMNYAAANVLHQMSWPQTLQDAWDTVVIEKAKEAEWSEEEQIEHARLHLQVASAEATKMCPRFFRRADWPARWMNCGSFQGLQPVKTSGILKLWSTGCNTDELPDDEDEGDELRSTELVGFLQFEEIDAERLGIVPAGEYSNRSPPRVARHRCSVAGCDANVFVPSFEAACAMGRASLKSEDCWFQDGLLHCLSIDGVLEDILGLGKYEFRSGENTDDCALPRDLTVFRCCAAGHIYSRASVCMRGGDSRV